jgi:hypothetical protein
MDEPFGTQLRATLNLIPANAWCAAPSGALTFVTERAGDYLGSANDDHHQRRREKQRST